MNERNSCLHSDVVNLLLNASAAARKKPSLNCSIEEVLSNTCISLIFSRFALSFRKGIQKHSSGYRSHLGPPIILSPHGCASGRKVKTSVENYTKKHNHMTHK